MPPQGTAEYDSVACSSRIMILSAAVYSRMACSTVFCGNILVSSAVFFCSKQTAEIQPILSAGNEKSGR